MAKMLTDLAHNNGHNVLTCKYGAKCCTTDPRKRKLIRRSARRIEKQEWRNTL